MAEYTGKNPFKIPRPLHLDGAFNVETLAGGKVLTYRDSQYQSLDPGGSHRNVAMPAAGARAGAWFWIANKANGAENLVLQQPDASTTLATLNQNEAALVFCVADGAAAHATGWSLFAIFTIAIA